MAYSVATISHPFIAYSREMGLWQDQAAGSKIV